MKGSGSHLSRYSFDEDHIQLEASGGSRLLYVNAPKEEPKGVQVPQCMSMLTNYGACSRSSCPEWAIHYS